MFRWMKKNEEPLIERLPDYNPDPVVNRMYGIIRLARELDSYRADPESYDVKLYLRATLDIMCTSLAPVYEVELEEDFSNDDTIH